MYRMIPRVIFGTPNFAHIVFVSLNNMFFWYRQDKKATAFPSLCDKLSDVTEIDHRIVVDGNVITSKGPGSALEFSLAIVEKLFGREKAIELGRTMLV